MQTCKKQLNTSKLMINDDTPDKLAEIIRNTWPQLYRPLKKVAHRPGHNTQKGV